MCGVQAVSYTHLDVYKRQVLDILVGVHRVLQQSLAVVKVMETEDVYKRQIVNRVVVRSSRTGALFGASGMGNNYVAKDLFVLCCRNGWSRTLAVSYTHLMHHIVSSKCTIKCCEKR